MNEIMQISNRSKKEILDDMDFLEIDHIDTIDPAIHIKQNENPLDDMIEKLKANKCNVHICKYSDVGNKIDEIMSFYKAKKLIYPYNTKEFITQNMEKICFDKEIEQLKNEVFQSDCSLVKAKYGVSSHGVLCITSDMGARLLSLASPVCIVLLDENDITYSLTSCFDLLEKEYKHTKFPANIIYLSGPSCTADIELIPIFGVHGSQNVEVVLYKKDL